MKMAAQKCAAIFLHIYSMKNIAEKLNYTK